MTAAAALRSSASVEWFTPAEVVDLARAVMGGIDLDPASCEAANQVIRARAYFTQEGDGLARPWWGRVWLNPPYGRVEGRSAQAAWSAKLLAEHAAGRVLEACLLVNATPGNAWWAPLWAFPVCFVARRLRFWTPTGTPSAPTHSNAVVYLGPRRARFASAFSAIGAVVTRWEEGA